MIYHNVGALHLHPITRMEGVLHVFLALVEETTDFFTPCKLIHEGRLF